MQELVDEGRVRALGLSNVDAEQIRRAAASGVAVVAVQNHYSLLRRDDDAEVLPLCRELGIGYVPYFPLASGRLTGNTAAASRIARARGSRPVTSATMTSSASRRSTREAERHGRSLLDAAIGGLSSIPGIASVIAGATSAEQVRANAAAGSWQASPDEIDGLLRAVA